MTNTESPPPPKRKASLIVRILPMLVGVGLLGGIGSLVVTTCQRDNQARDSRNAFNDKVAAGDIEGAYAEFTAERRAAMSLEEFRAYAQHPVIQKLNEGNFGYPTEHHPGICVEGEIEMPEGEWQVQMFFLEEDQWRLHSIALQRPATMGLARLLPECGFWRGTMMGYKGPPPEHGTPPTRKID